MIVERLRIAGCLRLVFQRLRDERGDFVKPYIAAEYKRFNLPTHFAEEYYSRSSRNVLRGMHFQIPPDAHSKLVSCLYGSIRDVIVDIRMGSPSYGTSEVIDLDWADCSSLYLPPGIAHGFLVLGDSALVTYKVTSAHVPAHDMGIRWDSIGVNWGVDAPIIS